MTDQLPKDESVAALDKAFEHLAAADAIAGLRNYPLAFALIVLGLEEWGKHLVLEALSDGLIEPGTPNESNPLFVDPGFFFDHTGKQLGALFLAAMLLPMRSRIALVQAADVEGRDVSRRELTDRLRTDLEASKRIIADHERLELLKEGGLYSGKRTRRGMVTLRASESEFAYYRSLLSVHLDIDRYSLTHPPSDDVKEANRKAAREFLAELAATMATRPDDPPGNGR